MAQFTSKDIEALREYLVKLEELHKEKPQGLTPEEWDEFFTLYRETGTFPAKYEGRVEEREIVVNSGIEDGKHVYYPEGKLARGFIDIAEESYDSALLALQTEYDSFIEKVVKTTPNGEPEKWQDLTELIKHAVSLPEVLDITNLPNLLPTDKRLQYAITPLRNEFAYIMPFDYEQLAFDYDENGEIVINSKAQFEAIEEAKDKKRKIQAAGIDQPLLRQLFAATMKAYLSNYGNSITVSLPSFAREMNIDVRGVSMQEDGTKHNANDFFKKLKALENLNGVWQGGSFYRVFILEGYDAEQNTLTFTSPWLFKVARAILNEPAAKNQKADGSIVWEMTGISSLMKPSIASARSKPTVEIIATLLAGLQQYGTKTEAKRHPGRKYQDKELVEYTISFKTLIERIPLIMENLNSCKPSNKTTLLQRYFCGSDLKGRIQKGKGYILDEYITEYTFIRDFYKDFQIIFQPPTIANLSDKIIIRHHGINGEFQQNNPLNALLHQRNQEEAQETQPEE